MKITAMILCAKNEEFIGLTLKSIIDHVDEIVIVGDPNRETRESIIPFLNLYPDKVKLLWREWDENYGKAKKYGLKHTSHDWILSIDADEVLENAHLLKREIKSAINKGSKVMNILFEHFIWHLGLLDDTISPHVGKNRLFHKKGVDYRHEIHEVAYSYDWVDKNKLLMRATSGELKIWHLGYIKSRKSIVDRYNLNIKKKGHTQEFIDEWLLAHMMGAYNVRTIDINKIPKIIQEYFGISQQILDKVNKNIKKEVKENEN